MSTDWGARRKRFREEQENAANFESINYDETSEDPSPSRHFVVSAVEFLAEQDDARPSLWGDGLLVSGGGYLIVGGEGEVGKTILLAGLYLSLAAGLKEYLGFPLPGSETPVLILEAEGSRPKFRARMQSVARAYGLDLAKLPIFFHARDATLSIDGDVLGEMLRESAARAVLLDPIGRFHDRDENSATEWRRGVTNPLGLLARERETAFAFSDHYVKPSELRRARHKLRGSAAKIDDCGAALRLEYGTGGKASRVLFVDRVRDGALPDPDRLALRIDVAQGYVEVDPAGVAEAVSDNPSDERLERKKQHESEEAQREIEVALKRLEAEAGWSPDDGVSERRLASEAGRSRTGRPFKMAMAGLQAQTAIESTAGGGWRRARRGEKP